MLTEAQCGVFLRRGIAIKAGANFLPLWHDEHQFPVLAVARASTPPLNTELAELLECRDALARAWNTSARHGYRAYEANTVTMLREGSGLWRFRRRTWMETPAFSEAHPFEETLMRV